MSKRQLWYTLDENNNPIPIEDLVEYCLTNGKKDTWKRVDETEIGDAKISTVFLGLDHNWDVNGNPILFETMIFSPNADWDQWQDRYETWDDAVKGHIFAVNAVKTNTPLNGRKILKLKL